jgi:hypothetical protein
LEITFDRACTLLSAMLEGDARAEILAPIVASHDLRESLGRLRDSMRCHVWRAGTREISLGPIVKTYDGRTREEGFHVLHDWDGQADQVNQEIIPIDVLDYVVRRRGGDDVDRTVVSILLDYYLLNLLALLSLRIWDEGDPDGNLDRLNELLRELQGDRGSGQQFASDAETLILIATSHFEPHERGYDALLGKVRTLNEAHRINIALGHAASMGSHLRFGFETTYARDTVLMRDDNVADYPWLCFALLTLMREFSRIDQEGAAERHATRRNTIVQALLNGLSADARAIVGEPPPSLAAPACHAERSEFCRRFNQHRPALLVEFQRWCPTEAAYSPLSFFFNFSHNVVKGSVVDALLQGAPWLVTLNGLLTAMAPSTAVAEPLPRARPAALATTLMGYARANPDRIRGRLTPVIVYDPDAGRRAFAVTLRKLNESTPLEGRASCL